MLYKHRQHLKSNNKNKPAVNNLLSNTLEYFFPGLSYDSDKKKSAEITLHIKKDFKDVFNGIECFDGTLSLQLKLDSKSYQVPLRCVAYVLQKPFEEELKRLQKHDITAPPGVDEMSEWCNSFLLVPKANRKVRLYLDPAWLNQALIRLVHREPTIDDILPKLNNVKYLSLTDAISGYHNLKLDKNHHT